MTSCFRFWYAHNTNNSYDKFINQYNDKIFLWLTLYYFKIYQNFEKLVWLSWIVTYTFAVDYVRICIQNYDVL